MATIPVPIPQTAPVEHAARYAVSGGRVTPESVDVLVRRLVEAYQPVRVVAFGL